MTIDIRDALTPAQARVLDAIIETGFVARAAEKLGITARTAETHLYNARRRCGIEINLHMLLAWDRSARQKQAVDRDSFLGWVAPASGEVSD